MYDALSDEEKLQYTEESFTQHTAAVEEWDRARKGPVSQKPEDRQRYVLSLYWDSKYILTYF
jgi:hypothetical protein